MKVSIRSLLSVASLTIAAGIWLSEAAGQVNTAGGLRPPAGTKVEAILLAPFEQGSSFQISPHGGHAATISHKGSRPVIMYDGVPGPMFDGLVDLRGGNHPVEFSPDGSHFGYCGLMSDHFSMMLDGKEVGRGTDMNQGRFDCGLFFSPNSKHFFFTNMVNMGSYRQGLAYTRLIMDGKLELKIGGFDTRNMVFSPDGDHYAMIIEDPMPGPRGEAIRRLVVDGKPVPFPGGAPQWSADSKHLYTMGSFNSPQGGGQELFLDGKPLMRASNITLTIPPVGDMTVAIVYVTNHGNPPPLTESWFLVVGGKKVPGSEIVKRQGSGASGNGIQKVYISHDGKHYAALCTGIIGKAYVFADGKKGLEYQRLNGLGSDTPELTAENRQQSYDVIGFTSESSKVIYIGFNDPSQYLVVGDEESKAPYSVSGTVISPTGDHVAVFGSGAPMLDGKYIDLAGINPASGQVLRFRFSPDGSHYSFHLSARGALIFVDGAPQSGYGWAGGTQAGLWSSDSKHFVYFCRRSDPAAPPSDVGLCLDGRYINLGQADPRNLTFTPDGNHIFFTEGIAQGGFRLFVDGKPVLEGFPTGGGVGSFSKETFEMQPDGTLILVAQDNTGLKRYAITAAPSTSIASLLGTASGAAANARR